MLELQPKVSFRVHLIGGLPAEKERIHWFRIYPIYPRGCEPGITNDIGSRYDLQPEIFFSPISSSEGANSMSDSISDADKVNTMTALPSAVVLMFSRSATSVWPSLEVPPRPQRSSALQTKVRTITREFQFKTMLLQLQKSQMPMAGSQRRLRSRSPIRPPPQLHHRTLSLS